ncbi:HxlR family transcriptional regulator [Williamsia sp. Leaf354]|uniref:winged helix-turn-helix transcriptional regulator n=1 Tax=Williamsia sp. Leaf354 TaxID=1736349 RepID=UPI0006FAACF6|nr:helix-turn-helix domain-containing protein [Williamsia sp. Leaf354]KQR99899.1 HxlR family transcriptional regulator [Williamsia sp. Leaf354]
MTHEDHPTLREPVRRAYEVCPVEVSVAVLGGARKMTIVKHLLDAPMRYGALGRAVGPVTPRVLTRQLRELESDGIVERAVFPEVPPKVVYSLTEQGKALAPFVEALNEWGKSYAEQMIVPLSSRSADDAETADEPADAGARG